MALLIHLNKRVSHLPAKGKCQFDFREIERWAKNKVSSMLKNQNSALEQATAPCDCIMKN